MHFLDSLWPGLLSSLQIIALLLGFITAVVQAAIAIADLLQRLRRRRLSLTKNSSPSRQETQPQPQYLPSSAQSQKVYFPNTGSDQSPARCEVKDEANKGEEHLIQQKQQER